MILNKRSPFQDNMPEILAPAGDFDALKGAIKGGAGAVYLGVKDFNARWGAENFTIHELESAIDFAHSYGVLVYLAFNIPVKQDELQEALDIIDRAYAFGVDAIILQDIGLLSLLKNIYPDLELRASTQMTIHNRAGIDYVADIGATRVILARELNTSELKDIVDGTDIGMEVFIHGALCYSYSGRCLFSSFLSGRSANRGACAQPCRKRYSLVVDGRKIPNKITGDYPISCAELCTLSGIDEIVRTGVRSLKIEGRMKKTEYVTGSTGVYRSLVEEIKNGNPPIKSEIIAREKELAKLFYRGFTKGFILGEKDVTNPKFSSNYGVFIGEILDISHFRYTTSLTIKLLEDVHVKDGIGILTSTGMFGSTINALTSSDGERVRNAEKGEVAVLEISSKTGKTVNLGDEVYLTTDTQLLKRLQETAMKTYPVSIKVTARKDEKLMVEFKGERGCVDHRDDYFIQHARKAPTTEDQIRTIMERLGDTPFFAKCIEIDADEDIFIPIGVLTNARREASDMLLQKTVNWYKKELKKPKLSDFKHLCIGQKKNIKNFSLHPLKNGDMNNLLLSVEVKNVDCLLYAVEAGADIVYIPIGKFESVIDSKNENWVRSLKGSGVEIVFIVPQITHDHELTSMTPLIEKVSTAGFTVACSNLGSVQVARTLNIPFVAQKELNTFNLFTVGTFYNSGAYRVTLSSELNLGEIKSVCDELKNCNGVGQVEIVVHGRELMLITKNELLKPLIDRKIITKGSEILLVDQQDNRFPVKLWDSRTLIYYSKVLCMLNDFGRLKESGADVLRLDLSLNSKKEVKRITKAYKSALLGKGVKMNCNKDDVYTKGHFFKGV
ncbi:MAG: U32 family peptidase [Methanosarcinaceae archaeon]|nr:U32 family peptidase [Methanosarcinaceae archaeon]